MTLQFRMRDLMPALLLVAVGIVIGLAFNAAPSRAQHAGGSSGYVTVNGEVWFCQGRDCVPLRTNRFA